LVGNFLCFYIQKSIASKKNEQPFIRNLLVRLQNDDKLRVEEMGIIFFSTRRGPDDQALPAGPTQDDGWCMFVSRQEDVGSLQDWLETVEQRLNDTEVSDNKDIFRRKVTFSCTSWGNHTNTRCLQDVIIDSDVARMVTGIYDLTKPKNRMNITNLPLQTYFHTKDEGVRIVQQYIDTLLDE
jgi:hypothetical protein